MIDWQSKGIDLSRFSGRTSGHVKVHCPQCHDRRNNKADKSLSCDLATGAYRCHYCGWRKVRVGLGPNWSKWIF